MMTEINGYLLNCSSSAIAVLLLYIVPAKQHIMDSLQCVCKCYDWDDCDTILFVGLAALSIYSVFMMLGPRW